MCVGCEDLPDDVQIANALRDRPDVVDVQRQWRDAIHWQLAESGLEARDTTECGRANDRAARLRAEGGHTHISCYRSCAAARRAAGSMIQIPRISRRRWIEAGPLGCHRLAEQDGSR